MAIFDTMQLIEPDVATYAMGLAASMGQFLLSAGARGKRHVLPHARVLMHQPSAGVGGTAADIAIQADMLTRTKHEMAQLIAEHTGQPLETHHSRLGPRPLVHRAGSAGVRLRGQGRHQGPARR